MSTPSNIEKFNEIAAKTFAILYEEFPVPRPLHFGEDFQVSNYQAFADSPESHRDVRNEVRFLEWSIIWLKDAGYISYKDNSPFVGFSGVVLTAKGFEVLNAVPESLTKKPAGLFLKEAVKDGVSKSITAGVQFVIAKGVQCIPHIVNITSN